MKTIWPSPAFEVEGGDALDAVDQRIEVGLARARAGPSTASRPGCRPSPSVLGLAEGLRPARLAGCRAARRRPPARPRRPRVRGRGRSPIRSARNASSAQYWRNTWTGRPSAAAPAVSTAAAWSLSSVPREEDQVEGFVHRGHLVCAARGGRRPATGLDGADKSAEPAQPALEHPAHQPAGDDDVRVGQAVADLATVTLGIDEARSRAGRARCWEALGWLIRSSAARRPTSHGPFGEPVQDLEPARVGERPEHLGLERMDLVHGPSIDLCARAHECRGSPFGSRSAPREPALQPRGGTRKRRRAVERKTPKRSCAPAVVTSRRRGAVRRDQDVARRTQPRVSGDRCGRCRRGSIPQGRRGTSSLSRGRAFSAVAAPDRRE